MAEKSGSKKEHILIEIANSISHGIGVILGIIFLLMLIIPSAKNGEVLKTIAFSIYGG